MLSSSDNLSAELFTKELGVHASQQGTTAAGTAAIVAKLHRAAACRTTASSSPTGPASTGAIR